MCCATTNLDYIVVIGVNKEDIDYIIKNNLNLGKKIVYSMHKDYMIPAEAFKNNEFTFKKMKEYVKSKGWDENNLGGYCIEDYKNYFVDIE